MFMKRDLSFNVEYKNTLIYRALYLKQQGLVEKSNFTQRLFESFSGISNSTLISD